MDNALIEAENERIDDLVGKWHQGGSGVSLAEFLGMTPEQYQWWLKAPDSYCAVKIRREQLLRRADEQALTIMKRIIRNPSLCERVLSVLDLPLDEVEAIFAVAGVSMERHEG